MGGGASSHQDAEMLSSLGLPPSVLTQFAMYEQECERKCFSAAKTFEFLTKKYEEYLKELSEDNTNESRSLVNQLKSKRADKLFHSKYAPALKAEDMMQIVLSSDNGGFIHQTKEARENQDLLDRDMAARLKEIQSLDLTFKIDSHSSDMVNDLFLNHGDSSAPSSVKVKRNKRASFCEVAASATQAMREKKKLDCRVCRIRFETASLLQAHVNHSELHAQNLVQLELNEADAYRKTRHEKRFKASTVARLKQGFERLAVTSEDSDNLSRYQVLWRKAYNSVRTHIMRESFARLTSNMVFIPNDVQNIFSGVKTFFRQSETVAVHINMYLHTLSHCVEVVSHVLNVGVIDLAAGPISPGPNSTPGDAPYFIPLPRVYLDYNSLLGCVMGNHKQESGLLVQNRNSLDDYAQNYRKTLGHHSRSVNLCMDRVMSSFVLSHLKMVKPRKHLKKGKSHGAGLKATNKAVQSVIDADEGALVSRSHSNSVSHLAALDTDSSTPVMTPVVSPRRASATVAGKVTPISGKTDSSSASNQSSPRHAPRLDLANDPVFADILKRILDYAVFFDDSQMTGASGGGGQQGVTGTDDAASSLVFKTPPEEVQPIAAVCLDQVVIWYEPAMNK